MESVFKDSFSLIVPENHSSIINKVAVTIEDSH